MAQNSHSWISIREEHLPGLGAFGPMLRALRECNKAKQTLEDQLEMLNKEYPSVPHTDAGRTFSTVRRMKIEKTMGLPINLRTGFAISVETGKAANEMTEDEWEKFYYALSERLNRDYPHYTRAYFREIKESRQIETKFWIGSRRGMGAA